VIAVVHALGMTDSTDDLPNDIESLKALLRAERGENARLADQNERLLHILRQLRRNHFGRKSEKLDEDQLNLGLEDLETAIASGEAAAEKADATLKASRSTTRKVNRGHLPAHLPREEIVIDPPSKACPCCGGELHEIGEERSERLDKIPARLRVIVTRRPKYACRSCTDGVVQASAPNRLIEGGLPTEALVADVVVSKYAWHQPLYRQSQQMATDDIHIDRSTLAHWVGFAAFELMPLYDRLVANLKASTKLFADETRCPVLDPGRGKTKTGYLWALARDDRPWGGTDPPAVAYMYAPGRGEVHAERHLAGFAGTLQVDGYVAYKKLTDPNRIGGPLLLANCWSHFRRLFSTLFNGGQAHLALIDSDDPLEAGLEIFAQPPGKKLQSLTLLSGGEQALTAVALIFGLFLTNPAPICVLDEVDAPLDDANIERFCDLLEAMTRETDTRYLIVTHNAVTMSRMHRLFGVTMVEQGISRLVSVDLGGAEQLLAAE